MQRLLKFVQKSTAEPEAGRTISERSTRRTRRSSRLSRGSLSSMFANTKFSALHKQRLKAEWENLSFERYGKTEGFRKALLKVIWESLQLLAFTINFVFLPLDIFLGQRWNHGSLLTSHLVLYAVADILNILDTGYRLYPLLFPHLHRNRAYRSATSFNWRKERDTKYKNGKHSKLDILSALPTDFVAYLIGYQYSMLFRLFKLLRISWLKALLKMLGSFLEYKGVMVNAGFQRTLALWYLFSLLAHWFGCAFYFIGVYRAAQGSHSWVIADGLLEYNAQTLRFESVSTLPHAYIRSLYWAIVTMVTVGLGDIVPAGESPAETFFTVIAMYVGVAITCVLVGNLTNLVANLDADEDEFHIKVDNLNKYMSYRHLSGDLQQRIRAYYLYMWRSLKGVDEDAFLKELPSSLRTQVAGLRSRDLITQVSFLRSANETFINALCFALEQIVVSPGDMVVTKKNVIQGAHFLARGEADQMGPTGAVVAQLSGKFGSHFGELSLFFPGSLHTNSVKAKSYCEFFFLPREAFDKLLKAHCEEVEIKKMQTAAEKAAKQDEKVQKFFGLDAEISKKESWWEKAVIPDSKFRRFWSLITLSGTIFNTFIIPIRITNSLIAQGDLNGFAADWTFDVLFLIDIWLLARHFAFSQEGILIRDSSKIFDNCKKSRSFLIRVFAALPFDVFAATDPRYLPWTRITKALLTITFGTHYEQFVKVLAAHGVTFTNAFHRLFKIFFLVIVFVHWIGCGWLSMAYYTASLSLPACEALGLDGLDEQCSGDALCRTDWLCMDHADESKTINHGETGVSYLRAVYFVLVDMTTVGYGDIVPRNTLETLFAALITLFGGFLYPAVVGAMAALIGNLNVAKANFKQKLATLTKFMEIKEFPVELRSRIYRYYDYLWSRQRGVDEDVILNDLPSPLRMEVQQAINGSIIENISFLHSAGPDFVKHILSLLKPAVFLPNDLIIRAGEYGQEMYLLERGAIKVTSADGSTVFAVLSRGDYFGEGCLLRAEKRTAAVWAIGYCDCFVLHRQHFQKLLSEFPEASEKIVVSLADTIEHKKAQNNRIISNFAAHQKLNVLVTSATERTKTTPTESFRHPESFKRVLWCSLVFCGIVYNAVVVPLRLTFQVSPLTFIADYLVDVLLLADVALNVKYFGYTSEGVVNLDKSDIVHYYKYKSGRRWIDLVASVPFDLLALSQVGAPGYAFVMALMRLPKAIRILQINKYGEDVERLLLHHMQLPGAMVKLLKLLFGVLIVSHYTACGFHMVAVYAFSITPPDTVDCSNPVEGILFQYLGSCPLENLLLDDVSLREKSCGATGSMVCSWFGTWVHLQVKIGLLPVDGGNGWEQYLRAINWAIPTLVVVVIGDVIPINHYDTLYVTIGIIVGVTINAAIIGNIANLVANLEGHEAQFRAKVDALEKFLHHYHIPRKLRERTRDFYQYVWETQKGYNQDNIVNDLPATLRYEVSSVHKLKFVTSCPFFEGCDTALLKSVAYSLTKEVFSPGDYIINEDEYGNEMFFVERGHLQFVLMNKDYRQAKSRRKKSDHEPGIDVRQTVISTASDGAYFGEAALFFGTRRTCSVQAIGYCELYVLSKKNLDDILLRFPFEREQMFNEVKRLMTSNDHRNKAVRMQLDIADPVELHGNGLQMPGASGIYASAKRTGLRFIGSHSNSDRISSGSMPKRAVDAMKRSMVFFSRVSRASSTNELEVQVAPISNKIRKMKFDRTHVFEHDEYAPKSGMLHPNHRFMKVWSLLGLFFCCFLILTIPFTNSFFVPGHGAFKDTVPLGIYLYALLEYLVDAFFIADCYIRATKVGVPVHGTLSFDNMVIMEVYRTKWLKLDVLANCPLEVFAFIPMWEMPLLNKILFLRMNRLVRLVHMPRLMLKLDSFIQDSHIQITSAWVQVIKMLMTFFLVNHVYACIWFFIHRYLEVGRHNTWAIVDGLATYDNIAQVHNIANPDVSIFVCYLRAFYFAVTTLSTVGYGDIRPYTVLETLFQLWVVLSGACLFAGIIGSVAVALYHDDANGPVAFSNRMRKLKEYMVFRELPLELQEQINEYFGKMWIEQRGVNTKEILSELPVPMQLDIAYATHYLELQRFPMIVPCNRHVTKQLALALNPIFVSRGNNVYSKGDIGHEVFFIVRGHVELHDEAGQLVHVLHEGEFFGNSTFNTLSGERKERVTATTDTRLFYIEKEDFDRILVDFPHHRGVGIFAELYNDVGEVGDAITQQRRSTVLDTFAEIYSSASRNSNQKNRRQSNQLHVSPFARAPECAPHVHYSKKMKRSRSVDYLIGVAKSISTEASLEKFKLAQDEDALRIDPLVWQPDAEMDNLSHTSDGENDSQYSSDDNAEVVAPLEPPKKILRSISTRLLRKEGSMKSGFPNSKDPIARKKSLMMRALNSIVRVLPEDELENELKRKTLLPDSLQKPDGLASNP